MTAPALAAPPAPAAGAAPRERRTVVPGDPGRPGLVSVVRPFTPEEQARHDAAFAAAEAAKEDILQQAREQFLGQARTAGVPPRAAMALMKIVRGEAGVSLTDLAARAGMQKSSLSRLENEDRNPTVRTLERVAAALGKRLVVRIEDLPAGDRAAAPPPAEGETDADAPAAD